MIRGPLALVLCLIASGALAQKRGGAPLLPGANSKDPVNINAAKLDYFDKELRLVYSGGVTAVQGDSSLRASVLTIFLIKAASGEAAQPAGEPTGKGDVRRMEATGPVTVTSRDQVGTGDNGVYDKIENRIVMTGHVKLSQGPNVTTGDQLVYDLSSGEAHVTGAVRSSFLPGSGGADAARAKPVKAKAR